MFKKLTVVVTASLASLAAAQSAPQDGLVDVGGAQVYYKVQGSGTPMLLIHGFPLNGMYFNDNVAALSKYYRVVTIDLRGFGRSTTTPGQPGSVRTYANDALAVMDKLGIDKAVIGGMSMGGQITLEMYRAAPQRFLGMLLIATTANPASITEQYVWRGVSEQATRNGVNSIVPELVKDMITGRTRMNRQQERLFVEGLIKQASLPAVQQGAQALAGRGDLLPVARTVSVPTLIVVGQEDTVYPVVLSVKLQQQIKGSRLVVIPNAAHAVNSEQAAAFNAAVLNWARSVNLR
ncbi:alpha/beta fold hydrolase [Deinococcus yavapaiensis]|uniref:Pimeloyl-ACP methyl ester carboxylesterase n=1 Tax=Deinococcus yavapaiensis KR-236 TaxID=694435 RepID=A0A318SCN4_9DEIO|nr:alpha/beta hydrolase [Deinococcus yavapaiensis]PYE55014.1 pimeloyl-ACP methyl ester carboxylesterase [Deinococcus yavapaiensis KR-236]